MGEEDEGGFESLPSVDVDDTSSTTSSRSTSTSADGSPVLDALVDVLVEIIMDDTGSCSPPYTPATSPAYFPWAPQFDHEQPQNLPFSDPPISALSWAGDRPLTSTQQMTATSAPNVALLTSQAGNHMPVLADSTQFSVVTTGQHELNSAPVLSSNHTPFFPMSLNGHESEKRRSGSPEDQSPLDTHAFRNTPGFAYYRTSRTLNVDAFVPTNGYQSSHSARFLSPIASDHSSMNSQVRWPFLSSCSNV